MIMNKAAVLLTLIFFSLCASAQSENESPERVEENVAQNETAEGKHTQLQELIVKGENAWFEDGKAVFIPRKSDKNLSGSMESLIERMNTGILSARNGSITTIGGQPVNIFINGVAVDDLDKATFWPKNAIRVEYMESSNDPQFQGKSNILNFIMKDYVTGGLTKFEAYQFFPNNGTYSASSKLVWGKMTYQAIFKGGYSRDHMSGDEMTENYDDVWYDGSHYDRISRFDRSDSYTRNNNIYSAFTARYRTKGLIMNHGIALQWNEDPGSGSHGLTAYTPDIIQGDHVTSVRNGHSLSPQVWGSYNWTDNPKWTAGGSWTFTHSHNRGYSGYEEGSLSPIVTSTLEDTYRYAAMAYVSYTPKNPLTMNLQVKEVVNVFDADYAGNTVSDQSQSNSTTNFLLHLWYHPIQKLYLSIIPEFSIFRRNVNHSIKSTEYTPGVNGSVTYYINSRHNIGAYAHYWYDVPPYSYRNDLILRQTELKWIEGNPSVKPSDTYHVGINYNARPVSWFDSEFYLNLTSQNNQSVLDYRSGGKEYAGVIGRYLNGGHLNTYEMIWNLGSRLLDGNLDFRIHLNYAYSRQDNLGKISRLVFRPSVGWNFGNCRIYADYETPGEEFVNGGTERIRTGNDYNLAFMYGNGNLYMNVKFGNIFTERRYTDRRFVSGAYGFDGRSWQNGRQISVYLTYTFDYGKKVDPGIDLNTEVTRSTSVLNSY